MLTRVLATLTFAAALISGVSARQATPAQQPPPKPAQQAQEKPAPEPPRPPARQNVKLDVTILDEQEGAAPVQKTVSMILADRFSGRIRTSGSVVYGGQRIGLTLNVDAEPRIIDDNRVHVDLGLEYAPKPSGDATGNGNQPPQLSERLSLVVAPGKPVVVSRASDPTSDRRITVELTATILK